MTFNHHNEELVNKLKNKKEAESFFYATLDECKKMNKKNAQQHLIAALKILRKAQGSYVFDNAIGNFFYRIIANLIFKFYKKSDSAK